MAKEISKTAQLVDLDLLDKKILFELDINSRMPITQLSKKVRANRNVVEYRMKRLEEKGVIQKYVTLIDAGQVGLMAWNIYLEFQNTTPEIEQNIIDYLKKHKKCWWIASTTGSWDLIYSILVKDIKEFYNTVDEFNSEFGQYILNQSLAAHVEIYIFSRGYFLNKASVQTIWYKTYNPQKIDEIDKAILSELSTNARIPLVTLAHKIGQTPRIVSYRINDLIKRKIITVFRLQLNPDIYGYKFYKVLIYLKNQNKKSNNLLREYCRQLGTIMHYELKIGPWMLELELDSKSYEEINELMKTMKTKFNDYIKSYEILQISEELKGELNVTLQL